MFKGFKIVSTILIIVSIVGMILCLKINEVETAELLLLASIFIYILTGHIRFIEEHYGGKEND